MSEWKKVKLGEITIIKTGKLDSNAAVPNGAYPFFTCDPTTLSIDKWAYDTEAILLAGNNASGNYTAKYYKGKFNAYQRTYIIETLNPQFSSVRYMAYAMNQQLQLLKVMSSGSTTKFLTMKMLTQLSIDLPSIETQNRIATILSRYDSLIENYQKQIKLLEEAAQRLYKEWFVDLHFPGHENTKIIDGVPEGWKKKKLGEIADVNCKSISRDYPFDFVDYIDLGAVREGHIEKPTRYLYGEEPGRAKRVASDGDIIWGMVRPNLKAYALVQNPKRSEVFSTGFSIITARDVPFSFLYCAVTTEAFVGYLVNCTNGAAYPAVKAEHFEKADLIIPSKMVLDNFHQHVGRMYRTIGYLQTQIRNLSEARDRLLPKLMSAEIEV